MSTRANYLSKYIDGPTTKEERKKKKKSHKNITSNISVPNAEAFDEVDLNDFDDPEESPVQVEVVSNKYFKGFKRIDNNATSDNTKNGDSKDINTNTYSDKPDNKEEILEGQNRTIYRDLTGKIIDIDEKRREVALKKLREKERDVTDQKVNLSDIAKLEKEELEEGLKSAKTFEISNHDDEYNRLMKLKGRFDDPLESFNNKIQNFTNQSKTGRFYYNKGVSPVNRFNIKAGCFWDGINRSNGFEDLVNKRREQKFNDMKNKLDNSSDEIDFD